jgi:hypothetical protein
MTILSISIDADAASDLGSEANSETEESEEILVKVGGSPE